MREGYFKILLRVLLVLLFTLCNAQETTDRRIGPLREVFAWRQLTFEVDGLSLLRDRSEPIDGSSSNNFRGRRQVDNVFFNNQRTTERNWNQRPTNQNRPGQNSQNNGGFSNRPNNSNFGQSGRPSFNNQDNGFGSSNFGGNQNDVSNESNQQSFNYPTGSSNNRPNRPQGNSGNRPTTSTTARPSDESGRYFVQYNNVPMGVERVGNRVFVTVPRRRYGIPSTLNYVDLNSANRSPHLRPYPDSRRAQSLVSVYRTRADVCGRLWMIDTGLLEIPDNRQQVQQPAIVIFDLNTDREILRYPFKSSDLPSDTTPTGLASITVDVSADDCSNAFAYVPDLTTNGIIIYSLRENDSWRVTHNYFHFNPTAGNLNIAGQRFQWNDGIFSITLTTPGSDNCRTAYFHPMVSTQEFSVSTCVLKNRTASSDSNYFTLYNYVGDRGQNSQSTMHGFHDGTRVIFFADIARDAVSCWNTGSSLSSANMAVIAKDTRRLSYPSDLHVTNDEVWIMANSMPRFSYARLNTDDYNFFIYRGSVQEMIRGTVCAEGLGYTSMLN